MFVYQLNLLIHRIDYYTDEHFCFEYGSYTFANEDIWVARQQLRLFLLEKQKDTTIVQYYEIALKLLHTIDNQIIDLGKWVVSDYPQINHRYSWDWEIEHAFFLQHDLLREGDAELLVLEQGFYQQHYPKRKDTTSLTIDLDNFAFRHHNHLTHLDVEIGIMYYLLANYQNSFEYLTTTTNLYLQWLTYHIALSLAFIPDFQSMKKYQELYPIPLAR